MSRRKHTVPNTGDTIVLDCGYGCRENYQRCTLLSWGFGSRLFDTGYDIHARVQSPYGDTFYTTLISYPGDPS
jgi:hypothetical protein